MSARPRAIVISALRRARHGDWSRPVAGPLVVLPVALLFAVRAFFTFALPAAHVLDAVLVYSPGVFVGLIAVLRFLVWRPRPAGPASSPVLSTRLSAATPMLERPPASPVHAAPASRAPDVTGVLGDYHDLVTTGYAVSVDDPAPNVLKAWFASLEARASRDGLTFTGRSFDEPPHYLSFIGVALLNLSDGNRPPENPGYYAPWGTAQQRRAALVEHLEADWGYTLVAARVRAEAELEATIPGWREHHRPHD